MEQRTTLTPGKVVITMVGLMLGVFMSAMDTTIVSTAMPKMARDLSGLALYAWPFTAYLICSTIATLVFGKLSDIWGRRTVFLISLVWFMIASACCGTSRSMLALIAFRGLQGIGGGVIISTAFAIVGEAFPMRERGKYMGLIGGMFGLASVIGPSTGGFIADSLGWRWIFYMNLPLGAAAIAVLAIGLAGYAEIKSRVKMDWAGIVLFIVATVPLLLGLSRGGKTYAWDSPQILGLFGIAIAAGIGLFFVERRAAQGGTDAKPFLPIAYFKDREYAAAALGSLASNAVFYAGILIMPLYLQCVLRSSATGSGLAITPFVLTYTLASIGFGQYISFRGRYRGTAVMTALLALLACVPLCFLDPGWGRLPVILIMLLLGTGLGATNPIFQVAAQLHAEPQDIGTVTSSIMFFRNLGASIGTAVYGAILSGSLTARLSHFDWGQAPEMLKASLENPQVLMNRFALDQIVAKVPAQYGDFVKNLLSRLDQVLTGALSAAFWAALAFALINLISCLSLGRGIRIPARSGGDRTPTNEP
jgi:EmrB/QacA subfamily drug resistance transporter